MSESSFRCTTHIQPWFSMLHTGLPLFHATIRLPPAEECGTAAAKQQQQQPSGPAQHIPAQHIPAQHFPAQHIPTSTQPGREDYHEASAPSAGKNINNINIRESLDIFTSLHTYLVAQLKSIKHYMYILFKIHRILLFQQAIQPRGVSLIHYLFKILHNNIASTSGCFFISRPGKHREGVQIWTPIDCHGSIGVHLQTCKDAWPCVTSSKPESPWLGPHFKSRGSNWTWEFFFKCLYLVKSCFFCFRA